MTYTPSDWYWQADDGRMFSSARLATVGANDAGLATHRAGVGYVTPWPRDDAGQQTMDSLQDVLAPHGISVDLRHLQARLCADIDDQAEQQRLKYITGGAGQAMVYLQKQTQAAQALAALSAAPPMTADQGRQAYPLLAAEIGITVDPSTDAPAGDVFGVARIVQATVQSWLPVAAAIEAMRLRTKAAIGAALTVPAAHAARDAAAWPTL